MTALAGLPVYLDLASAMGINESIEKYLHIKQQGWMDSQTLLSLILMNIGGVNCVEDLRRLWPGICAAPRDTKKSLKLWNQ